MRRVFFRKEYKPDFITDRYIAVFPEEEAKPGKLICVPVFKDNDDKWIVGSRIEASIDYLFLCGSVRKTDPVVPSLISSIDKNIKW